MFMIKQRQRVSYQGEISALVSALTFAVTPYFFLNAYKSASPYVLNFWKVFLSFLIMLILLLISGEPLFPYDTTKNYTLLILSGISGLGIADTLYFKAFESIGPRQVILLETIAPTFTGLISYVYFGTTLSFLRWTGMVVTALGILIVVYQEEEDIAKQPQENPQQYQQHIIQDINPEQNSQWNYEDIQSQKTGEDEDQIIGVSNQSIQSAQKQKLIGFLIGIGFSFFQSLGMVLAHDAAQSGKFIPLQTSFIRILTAIIYILIMLLFNCQKIYWPSETKQQSLFFVGGITFGPFLGVWSQQISLKYTIPEITQTIIAISPIFGLIIGFIRGDHIKFKDFGGSIISILGVAMVVWL